MNNCWICNGWREINFTWIPGFSDPRALKGPVYIHLSFMNYKGVYMGDSYDRELTLFIMVPYKEIFYFFTVMEEVFIGKD